MPTASYWPTDWLDQSERVGLFVDGSNFHPPMTENGGYANYEALREFFKVNTNLVQARFYAAYTPDMADNPLKPLLDRLAYRGFRVVSGKPSAGRGRKGGSMVTQMATDILTLATHAPRLEHIVLCSGDGDFVPVLSQAQDQGMKTTVISAESSLNNALCQQADNYLNPFQHSPLLEKSAADL